MISASENFLVESDCFLHNKISPFLVDRIYPIVVEIKDATDIDKSASYLEKGRLRTKFYDK
jgi:hypothetical protein